MAEPAPTGGPLRFDAPMRAKDQLGLDGEAATSVHLERAGMRIVERRWRCAYGELDIVALDGDEAAAIDDVLRQLREAGIEPDREQAATMVREERSKRTES